MVANGSGRKSICDGGSVSRYDGDSDSGSRYDGDGDRGSGSDSVSDRLRIGMASMGGNRD
jgi:hypothetical protein